MAYVLLGIEISDETLELIDLFQKHPEKRDGILLLLSDRAS
ncbi:MAG: hypothetical protein AAF755_10190 [Pseudomonadota bacterium]